VVWDGRPLAIPRRQARALLYRLAAHLKPIPRETLCFIFWPDRPESTARRNLSHLLTHLRRALPAPGMLLVTEDQVGLDPRHSWSDAVAFEQLCSARGTLRMYSSATPSSRGRTLTAPSRGVSVDALQQALALYRGPFLASFYLADSAEFEAWVTREQRTFEQLYLEVLVALLDERMARGEYEAAKACARQYLATDDLAEDVHRRLIELYAVTGNRSAALRQFERCAAILERELGVSPLPATRAVYQAVAGGYTAGGYTAGEYTAGEYTRVEGRLPAPNGCTHPQHPTAGPGEVLPHLPSLDAPLIGREKAWSKLEEAYVRTLAGQGQVVLISGEPGIGKSRLMQDFVTHVCGCGWGPSAYTRIPEALILVGGSQPEERTLPYQPIAQALRSVLNAEHLAHIQPIWLAEAARLVPELRILWPDLPPPLPAEPDEARTRLFEALCQIVLGLAAGPRPVLLCLDDLNWADSATLDWLGFLGRRLSNQRLLILGTYRSGETGTIGRLRHSLAHLGILSEVALVGLGTASVLQILCHLSDPFDDGPSVRLRTGPLPSEEGLAERLQQATGGNPFFLMETLRALTEAGQQPEGAGADGADGGTSGPSAYTRLEALPLPDTVRQAVEARLDHLSPQARQVLEAGAILGEPFGFDLVHLTAGRGELEAMDGLDALVARQLLAEEAPGYRFQHDLIRRATEAGLSPVRRQLLHRRAGRALEQLSPDAVAALAHHFDEGGVAKKALHYHDLAAQRAEALFAWEEAEKHQSRMLELLELLDPGCRQPDCLAQRGQLLAARAHQRYLQGRLAERDADLTALESLAETSSDEPIRLLALVHRVRYLNLDAQYEKAIVAAEKGLVLAKRLNDAPTHCRLLAQIGFAYYFLGRPQPALTALESALTMTGEETTPEPRGRITHILGYVYFHLGDYARSLACQQEAYTCHQQVGDHNRVAWDGLDIAAVYLETGHFAEAKQYLDEHLALARRIGARPAEAYGVTLLGCWGLHRGDYVASADCFQQALSLQEGLHSEHGRVAAELGMGLASYHLADLAGARHWLECAAKRGRSIGHRRRLVEVLVGLGLVEIAAGRPSIARRCLTEAVTIGRESKCQEGLAAGLAALACAERHLGNPAGALACAAEAVRVAREITLPACEMWGEMEVGMALWAQGEFGAALEHTERAVALIPRAHEGWIGTEEVHRAHARVLRALGHAKGIDEQIRQAEEIIESKAAHIRDPELRQRYRQLAHSLAR